MIIVKGFLWPDFEKNDDNSKIQRLSFFMVRIFINYSYS